MHIRDFTAMRKSKIVISFGLFQSSAIILKITARFDCWKNKITAAIKDSPAELCSLKIDTDCGSSHRLFAVQFSSYVTVIAPRRAPTHETI